MTRTAEALRKGRKAAGLTQHELAVALGITQPTLADIERGRRALPRKHFAQLPDAIRKQVIDAAIAELRDQISELRAMR